MFIFDFPGAGFWLVLLLICSMFMYDNNKNITKKGCISALLVYFSIVLVIESIIWFYKIYTL